MPNNSSQCQEKRCKSYTRDSKGANNEKPRKSATIALGDEFELVSSHDAIVSCSLVVRSRVSTTTCRDDAHEHSARTGASCQIHAQTDSHVHRLVISTTPLADIPFQRKHHRTQCPDIVILVKRCGDAMALAGYCAIRFWNSGCWNAARKHSTFSQTA